MKLTPLRTLMLLGAAGAASAFGQILTWNTFGNTGTETSEPSVSNSAFITASSLTLGPGVTGAGNTNRFGGSNWFDTGDTAAGTTLAESISGNDYIQFTITPVTNARFTVTSFVFSWDRSNTGPSSVALRSSQDSYASNLGTVTGLAAAISTGNTISITSILDVSVPVTFRLYGYGGTATGGTGGFDTSTNAVNVAVFGSAIPEPSSFAALAGFAALGGAALRRRRRA